MDQSSKCGACDAPGASQPSSIEPGVLLCSDVVACLQRALPQPSKLSQRRARQTLRAA